MSSRTTRLAAMLAALAAFVGCKASPDLGALCDEVEKCIGGNDRDLDACLDARKLDAKVADAKGCGDEFDAYIACLRDNAECAVRAVSTYCNADADCTNAGYGPCRDNQCTTKAYGPKASACVAEGAAYSRCTSTSAAEVTQ